MPTEESSYIITIELEVNNEAIHYKIFDNGEYNLDSMEFPVPLIHKDGTSQLPEFQNKLAKFLQRDTNIISHFNAYQQKNTAPAPAAKSNMFARMFTKANTTDTPKAGGKKTKSNRSYNANKTLKNKK